MVRVLDDVKLDFTDVLIRPKRSTLRSRAEVSLARTFTFKHSGRTLTSTPIIASNMDTVGTFDMADELSKHGLMTAIHKHYTAEQWKEWRERRGGDDTALQYVAASTGILDDDWESLTSILDQNEVHTVCLDVANGYSEMFVNFVRRVREKWPKHTIMVGRSPKRREHSHTLRSAVAADRVLSVRLCFRLCAVQAGNVVTGEMVEELILSGADVVKVGIGPGSVCTTRKKTGVGYPQLSAVMECADAAHGLGGMICSDGGCNCPGDVAKAFGGGADFVMMGGMLAGHAESGGQRTTVDGREYVEFYGMSSSTAMQKHVGKVAEYRASEGKTVRVPYRGPVRETVLDILGGLRSACTYVGADKLKDLPKRTTFIRVSQQTNDVFGNALR